MDVDTANTIQIKWIVSGIVVVLVAAALCITAYQIADRLGPERPVPTEKAK